MDYSEQEILLDKLEVFKFQGRDKRSHKILRIIGKVFPGRKVSCEGLRKYLAEKIFPEIGDASPFSVVYINTCVQRNDISTVRSIFDSIPFDVKDRIQSVYFLHPGFQTRLLLAAFGRFLLTRGVYGKIKYVIRVEFLWEHVKREEMEVPEYVYGHDEELEYRPRGDDASEIYHLWIYGASPLDYSVSLNSMRCIA